MGAGRASPPVAAFVVVLRVEQTVVEEDPDSRAVRVDARMCMAGDAGRAQKSDQAHGGLKIVRS